MSGRDSFRPIDDSEFVLLTPPSDEQRRRNESSDRARATLTGAFKDFFGRWPTEN